MRWPARSDVPLITVSAVKGVGQIWLGNLLGSNVFCVPFVVAPAHLAAHRKQLDPSDGGGAGRGQREDQGHPQHVEQGVMRLTSGSVTTAELPYLGLVAGFPVLAGVPVWRGLQPSDRTLVAAAYLVFLTQAVLRGRGEGQQLQVDQDDRRPLGGLASLAVGGRDRHRVRESCLWWPGCS